jgi:hypothetical protein
VVATDKLFADQSPKSTIGSWSPSSLNRTPAISRIEWRTSSHRTSWSPLHILKTSQSD